MEYDVVEERGTTSYYMKGTKILHRIDGPAVKSADGYTAWWKEGKRHREDGPAVIDTDGYEAWYKEGLLHREDGPAVVEPCASTELWYKEGLLHREDGPASVSYAYKAWYINGVQLSK